MRFNLLHPRHPDTARLLAWSEGELSWWRSRMVARHVRSCWHCKGQTRELEAIVCAASLSIAELPEPSRVETAKAYWRFREACLEIDPAPQARRMRMRPAWAIAAAAILATAGLAYVTTQQHFRIPPEKQASPRPKARTPRPPEVATKTPVASVREAIAPAVPPRLPQPEQKHDLDMLLPGPSEAELLAAEIHALAALHRSRFCLNSAITVGASGSAVEISGFIQSQDQRDRLRGLLEGTVRPDLMLIRLSDPTQIAGRSQAEMELQPGRGAPDERVAPPIESWLRDSFKVGSRATEREMFNLMNAVVLESEKISSEAWAIRHLAEQFPPDRTRRLSPDLSDQLLQMADDHAIALGNSLHALRSRLQPVLQEQPARSYSDLALGPDETWQSRVMALQQRAEAAVARLLGLFSTAAPDVSPPNSSPMPDFSALLALLDGQFRECAAAAADLRASIRTICAETRRVQSRNEDR